MSTALLQSGAVVHKFIHKHFKNFRDRTCRLILQHCTTLLTPHWKIIPKNKAEKRIPSVPVPQRVYGRRRSITVEQRIYNLIREEELVSKIPYPGYRICKNGKICGPCRLVEAFKLARNQPKVWHDIIYKGRGPNVGSVAAAPQQTGKSHRVMGRHTAVAARKQGKKLVGRVVENICDAHKDNQGTQEKR